MALTPESLTRGFTLPECSRFNFGEECPTIAELDDAAAADGTDDALAGTYRLEWSHDDLLATIIGNLEDFTGEALPPEAIGEMSDLAAEGAGVYTLTFVGGRFDIVNDRVEDPFCTGTYSVDDGRAWLRSERGGWCYPIKLFDAAFEIDDEALRFDPDRFRGQVPLWVLFTSRPLERV